MIVPEAYEKKFSENPNLEAAFKHFPQAYFGYFIRYPKQAEIIRTWLKVRPKICVISGWKRTSKTSVAAYLASCWLTGKLDQGWPGARAMDIQQTYEWNRKFNGERVGIIAGSSLDHVENVLLKMYKAMIPPSRVHHWFTRTSKRIELENKSQFLVRTYEQAIDDWKSGNSQFTHLDEEPPWNVMSEAIARSLSLNGKIIITLALDDADVSWLPEACANPKEIFGTDSFLHFKLGLEDVPDEIVPQESKEIEFARYDNTPLRLAVRKGEWGHVSQRWWKNFDPIIHIIPAFKLPDHLLKWRFMDAGVAAPCACVWVAMDAIGNLYCYREYYKIGTTIDERCRDVIELSGNERKRDGEVWTEIETREKFVNTQLDYHEFREDPTTGDGLDFHYIKAGLIVSESTTLRQEARREVINRWLEVDPTVKHFQTGQLGAPRIYIFDTCVNLIKEAQTKSVKREASVKTGISEIKIDNRGDHAMDCVEYAVCELEYWCDNHRNKEKKKDRIWDEDKP